MSSYVLDIRYLDFGFTSDFNILISDLRRHVHGKLALWLKNKKCKHHSSVVQVRGLMAIFLVRIY